MPTVPALGYGLGWRKDRPDPRDRLYLAAPVDLPVDVDLRPGMPEVYDQGSLGSCTGNAVAGAVEYLLMKLGDPAVTPSRLFIYYGERVLENSVDSDAGAEIRDGIKVVAADGVCPEPVWPYDVARFAEKPSVAAYGAASLARALTYESVHNSDMQNALARGLPVVIGFLVYDSFSSIGSNGLMPLPRRSEQILGGHAVLVVGYRVVNGLLYFLVRNSWGPLWGLGGYFLMPAAFLLDRRLVSDCWAIDSMSDPTPAPGPVPVPATSVDCQLRLEGRAAQRFLRDVAVLGITPETFASRLVSRHYRVHDGT